MITREDIINKIRKYAKKNNKTPSEIVFYELAGIGIYDLKKLGWPYYGALVREAKLKPNKFDRTKYSREQLCKIFIEFMRELGKWPTRGDLDVKHYNDKNFPASATFYKKLNKIEGLAKSVMEFIEGKRNYDDIATICKSVFEKYSKQVTSPESADIMHGFVYLGKQHGRYKIGYTTDLNRRREDISLLGSEPIEWIHSIETDDMKGIEKYWHDRFASKWMRGEWFKLAPSDIKSFKRWRKIY